MTYNIVKLERIQNEHNENYYLIFDIDTCNINIIVDLHHNNSEYNFQKIKYIVVS